MRKIPSLVNCRILSGEPQLRKALHMCLEEAEREHRTDRLSRITYFTTKFPIARLMVERHPRGETKGCSACKGQSLLQPVS